MYIRSVQLKNYIMTTTEAIQQLIEAEALLLGIKPGDTINLRAIVDQNNNVSNFNTPKEDVYISRIKIIAPQDLMDNGIYVGIVIKRINKDKSPSKREQIGAYISISK